MHLSLAVLTLFVVIGTLLSVLSFLVALKVFRLKPKPEARKKIILFIVAFTLLESGSSIYGRASVFAGIVSTLGFAVGLFLWVLLLKRYKVRGFSNVRAVSSYIFANAVAGFVSVILALFVIASVARVYEINGRTMEPAYQAGEHVLVLKYARHPSEDDVIVYRTLDGTQAIGRVHAVPRQSITIPTDDVLVDGKPVTANSFRLDEDQYYVSGDNPALNTTRIIESKNIIGTIGPRL